MDGLQGHFSPPQPSGWWMEGMNLNGVLEGLVQLLVDLLLTAC